MKLRSGLWKRRQGSSTVLLAFMTFLLFGVGAFATDLNKVLIPTSELQRAPDAGALEGARALYCNDGNIKIAGDRDVGWVAPRATARISHSDVDSLAAQDATLLAPVGLAATLPDWDVVWPLAICGEAVETGCPDGGVIRNNADTSRWTDFEQPCDGAADANAVKDLIFDCGGQTIGADLILGLEISTSNRISGTEFNVTYDCFTEYTVKLEGATFDGKLEELDPDVDGRTDGFPSRPWKWLLPVIDCDENKPNTCKTLFGAVVVEVLWMFDNNSRNLDDYAPRSMARYDENGIAYDSWNYIDAADVLNKDPETNGLERWSSFVDHFDLMEPDGTPALPTNKTVYYAPACDPAVLLVGTGAYAGTDHASLLSHDRGK